MRGEAWFEVWCPDRGQECGDNRSVRATSAAHAATAWAERDDYESAEFSIVGGNDAIVTVRDPNGDDHRFTIHGESIPHYTARVLRDPTNIK